MGVELAVCVKSSKMVRTPFLRALEANSKHYHR
jgi:hypothetical protein